MVKIHWLVWLIVGSVMTFFSGRLGSSFLLFFYLGLLFVAVGIAKAIMAFVFRKKEAKAEKMQVKGELSGQSPQVQACRYCMSRVRGYDNYCWHCGSRLR